MTELRLSRTGKGSAVMLQLLYHTVLTIPVHTGNIEINVPEHFVRMNVHIGSIVTPVYIRMPETASAMDWRPLMKADRSYTSRDAQVTIKDDSFMLVKLNLDGQWFDVHGTPSDEDENYETPSDEDN